MSEVQDAVMEGKGGVDDVCVVISWDDGVIAAFGKNELKRFLG